MFGPNKKPGFHHRSDEFRNLFKDLTSNFKRVSYLNESDKVLFITGSGTLANEIVISSLNYNVHVVTTGSFSKRLTLTGEVHPKPDTEYLTAGVQYETSVSKYNRGPGLVVDCISGFPYYELPQGAVIMTTVSSKQFGSTCGVSVIIIRDWETNKFLFKPETHSYLSLMKYVRESEKNETPNTPAISIFQEFNDILKDLDVVENRRKIDEYRSKLEAACEKAGYEWIGDGPVFTFKNGQLPTAVVEKLYTNSGHPQLFLSSADDEMIDNFIKEIL